VITLHLILLILAVVCFALAAANVQSARFNLVAGGRQRAAKARPSARASMEWPSPGTGPPGGSNGPKRDVARPIA
jgi:hypothetical protein